MENRTPLIRPSDKKCALLHIPPQKNYTICIHAKLFPECTSTKCFRENIPSVSSPNHDSVIDASRCQDVIERTPGHMKDVSAVTSKCVTKSPSFDVNFAAAAENGATTVRTFLPNHDL